MPGAEAGAYARFGVYCSGLQDFDAAYFMLPASETLALDPHTRHLLHLSQVLCLQTILSYQYRKHALSSAANGTCLKLAGN